MFWCSENRGAGPYQVAWSCQVGWAARPGNAAPKSPSGGSDMLALPLFDLSTLASGANSVVPIFAFPLRVMFKYPESTTHVNHQCAAVGKV